LQALRSNGITQLAQLIVSDYSKVFDEFIEFKNDTNFEAIFKEKREQKEYMEFWYLLPGKYKTLQKHQHIYVKLHIQK